MDQSTFIQHVTDNAVSERLFRGLFLAGSFGAGKADAFSDVDFVALVEPAGLADAADRWRKLVQAVAPVVFWSQRGQDPILLNAITGEWLRCDLVILRVGQLTGRAQSSVVPLVDLDAVFATLPKTLPPAATDPKRVLAIVTEFLRVLGLLQVVMGRGEYLNAVGGAGLLRDLLTQLMLEEAHPSDRGGVLHLSKLLPAADLATLSALPFPCPAADPVVEAHFATFRVFRPRAYRLCASLGLPWPERFESATLNALDERCRRSTPTAWRELAYEDAGLRQSQSR